MSVVACPKCTEKVSLPPKTPPAAKVRCPLCGDNYLLSEAMDTLPPMLEVLELPEGYSPIAEDVDISAAAFLASPDRKPPSDEEDEGELRLEGAAVGIAIADEDALTPRYDAWGPTSSSLPTHEIADVTPKRDGLAPGPPRKKKPQINPVFHIFGIVMGGIVAIPAALMILLWLPGSLHRDPMEIGPWLAKNAPFLAPAKFHTDSTDALQDKPTKPVEKPVDKSAAAGPLGGDKFDEALKNANMKFGPDKQQDTLFGGRDDDGQTDKPLDPDAVIDDTLPEPEPSIEFKPEPVVKPEPQAKPENKPEPKPEPDDALKPDEPKPESTDEPKPEPDVPKPEPSDEPKPNPTEEPKPDPDAETKPDSEGESSPEVSFELPETSKPQPDPLSPQRAALHDAHEAYNAATAPADKKAAAIAMYRAAAELAEKLPSDIQGTGGLDMLINDSKIRQFLGVYAATWQQNEDRATPGIVLSGVVKGCRSAGERYEVLVELPSRDKRELLVISPAECQPGDRLFVAGRFVANAKDLIKGYTGDAVMAIDARVLQVLDK